MKISELELYKKYNLDDLRRTFGNKSFMQGMVYTASNNTLVLISKYTKGRIYQDKIENGIIHYTGMGQEGDQKLALANKRLANAKRDNTTVYLFLVFKEKEYTYYGKVSLDDPYYFEIEPDVKGNLRNVYKFPLTLLDAMAPLAPDVIASHVIAGNVPTINVVGAAIFDGEKVLCAQRGIGKSLEGKWEFPGGKVEKSETNQEALKRELKEELDIEISVNDLIDVSKHYDGKRNIVLSVYKANIKSGNIKLNEHQKIEWHTIKELEELDWADNDIEIVQSLIDSLPRKIINVVDYKYKKADKKVPKSSEVKRSLQDYEKSQKTKAKAGNDAEKAVIDFEVENLVKQGRSDLANQIEQVSKISSDYGYDIKSFKIEDGKIIEKHIEVKSATIIANRIEFFISQAELRNCSEDENYCIYALIRHGSDYNLHIVKKDKLLSGEYSNPISYKVSIPVEEL